MKQIKFYGITGAGINPSKKTLLYKVWSATYSATVKPDNVTHSGGGHGNTLIAAAARID